MALTAYAGDPASTAVVAVPVWTRSGSVKRRPHHEPGRGGSGLALGVGASMVGVVSRAGCRGCLHLLLAPRLANGRRFGPGSGS